MKTPSSCQILLPGPTLLSAWTTTAAATLTTRATLWWTARPVAFWRLTVSPVYPRPYSHYL